MLSRENAYQKKKGKSMPMNPLYDGSGIDTALSSPVPTGSFFLPAPVAAPDPTARYFHGIVTTNEDIVYQEYSSEDSALIEMGFSSCAEAVQCTNPIFEVRFGANARSQKVAGVSATGFLQVCTRTID